MKVLIATKNAGKIKKYSEMLKEIGADYCTLHDIDINVEVEETGKTVEENSLIKAKAYYEATKMPLIVDDSGMELYGLSREKQPGVYVRRHDGIELTDEEIINFYSKEIEEIGGFTDGAFNIAITVIDDKGKAHTKTTKHERYFVSKPCTERTKGYPMNSLIYDKEKGKYLAQIYDGKTILNENKNAQKELNFINEALFGKENEE